MSVPATPSAESNAFMMSIMGIKELPKPTITPAANETSAAANTTDSNTTTASN